MRFFLVLFCTLFALVASTSQSHAARDIDKIAQHALSHAQHFITQHTGRRAGSLTEICSQYERSESLRQIASSTIFSSFASQLGVQPTCVSTSLEFLGTICSTQCRTSPLVSNLFAAGNRRFDLPDVDLPSVGAIFGPGMLGGLTGRSPGSDADASTTCKDSCYIGFMQSLLALLKVYAGESGSQCLAQATNQAAGLLPGASVAANGIALISSEAIEKMERAFGFLCSVNEQGQYCMEQASALASLQLDSSQSTACQLTQAAVSTVKKLGCCWNVLLAAAGASGFTIDFSGINQAASSTQCGKLDLSEKVCPGDVAVASVRSSITLGGMGLPAFNQAEAKQAFVKGLCSTAGLSTASGSCVITKIEEALQSRRIGSGVVVESVATITGPGATPAATAVQARLADTTALQASIASATAADGTTPLSAAIVSQVNAATAFSAQQAEDDAGLSTGAIVGIAVGTAAGVALLVAVAAVAVKRGSKQQQQQQREQPEQMSVDTSSSSGSAVLGKVEGQGVAVYTNQVAMV